MRRIARLRKPSGFRYSVLRQSIASSTHQSATTCAPLSTASPSRTRISRLAPSSLRPYSQQSPSTLPGSLGGVPAEAQEVLPEAEAEDYDYEAPFRIPPQVVEAENPKAVSDSSYTPATVSDGLESVGGLENWWDQKDNWGTEANFRGFKASKKIEHPDVLETAVRRAVIEASLLRMNGREEELVEVWPLGGPEEMERVLNLDIQIAPGGAATVAGDVESVAADLRWEDEAVEEAALAESQVEHQQVEPLDLILESKVSIPRPQEATGYLEKWGSGWTQIPLSDPRIKFAVTKRVFQLTGQLIPDHKLPQINSVQSLLTVLKRPPKPKTLAIEIEQSKQELVTLPNVVFSAKRMTRGEKAKAVGMYKVIEAEFTKRDLQGSPRSVVKGKEQLWQKGEA